MVYDHNFLVKWRQKDSSRRPLATLVNVDYYSDKLCWKERLNDIDKDENINETSK